jgi:hypothetical protein
MIGLDRQLPTEIGIEQLFEILAIHYYWRFQFAIW